jgi:hypothetical protein
MQTKIDELEMTLRRVNGDRNRKEIIMRVMLRLFLLPQEVDVHRNRLRFIGFRNYMNTISELAIPKYVSDSDVERYWAEFLFLHDAWYNAMEELDMTTTFDEWLDMKAEQAGMDIG